MPSSSDSASSTIRDDVSTISARDLKHPGLWIGFAAVLSWFDLVTCFEGVLCETEVSIRGISHDPFFLCATASSGAFLLLLAAFFKHRPLRRAPFSSTVILVFAIMGAITSAVMTWLAIEAPTTGTVAPCLLGIIWGVCFAVVLLAWGSLLTGLELRSMLIIVSAASCIQWLPLLVVPVMATLGKMIAAALLPLVAFACYLRIARTSPIEEFTPIPADEPPQIDDGDKTVENHRVSEGQFRPHRFQVARLAIATFLFAAAIQFTWTYCVKQRVGGLWPKDLLLVFLVVIIFALLIFTLTTLVMGRLNRYRLEIVYRLALFLGICGATSLAVAPENLFFSYTIIYVGYSVLLSTLFMLMFGYLSMRGGNSLSVLGCVCGCLCLGFSAGFLACELPIWMGFIAKPNDVGWASFAAVAVFCAAGILMFPERVLLQMVPMPITMDYRSLDDRCKALAKAKELSPRETDVLMLLARGRNASYIADVLCISPNTAATHRKNVYRKLDVHNQQELLTLVEAEVNSRPN